jgi:uncharacterized UPF0160 family protein
MNQVGENKSEKLTIPSHGFTHGGCFHADDVFATALLSLVNPDFTWRRGNEVPADFDGIVYDIGGGEYDHHQVGARVRENGVPFAAFGLVWEKYGCLLLDPGDVSFFDEKFVQMIDLTDNTGKENPISTVIRDMNPEWNEEVDQDLAFSGAVDYAKTTLSTWFKHLKAKREAAKLIEERMLQVKDRTLDLGMYLPWNDYLWDKEVDFVIFPSNRGGFSLQTVAHDPEKQRSREFPKEWGGLRDAELEKVSGIRGMLFCHKAGFLCVTETLEAAWEVVRYMEEMTGNINENE